MHEHPGELNSSASALPPVTASQGAEKSLLWKQINIQQHLSLQSFNMQVKSKKVSAEYT